MRVTTHLRWACKAGSQAHEYEDAFWPMLPVDRTIAGDSLPGRLDTPGTFVCALTDGATESSYARIWAKLLARATELQRPFDEAAARSMLPALQRQWSKFVAQRVQQQALPWYVEEKASSGAFAAWLGLELYAGQTWRAIAVGDCCLVHRRGPHLIGAFPLTRAEDFTSRPYLLSSQPARNGLLGQHLRVTAGAWCAGDEFWLMTDALAQWFWMTTEREGAPWPQLLRALAGDALHFEAWLAPLRASRAMRNDDVTLLRVCVADEP